MSKLVANSLENLESSGKIICRTIRYNENYDHILYTGCPTAMLNKREVP